MIEYIYSDIDNCLNNQKAGIETLLPPIRQVLQKMKRKGLHFGVVTTRGFLRAKEVVGDLCDLPFIVLNGSEVYDTKGIPLRAYPLTRMEKEMLLENFIQNEPSIHYIAFYPKLSTFGKMYVSTKERLLQSQKKYKIFFKNVEHDITTDLLQFCSWLTVEETSMVEVSLSRDEKINFPPDLHITYDGNFYITAQKVDKGFSVMEICKEKSIPYERLLVIGDSPTDMSLLTIENCTSISVANLRLKSTCHVESPEKLASLLELFT